MKYSSLITRRGFIYLLTAVSLGALSIIRSRKSEKRETHGDFDQVALLAVLSERLIPAFSGAPSARDLGLHEKFLSRAAKELKVEIWRKKLIEGLAQLNFLTLSSEQQLEILRVELQKSHPSDLGRAIQFYLDQLVEAYYSDERIFPFLAYRIPQPAGYPEYSAC